MAASEPALSISQRLFLVENALADLESAGGQYIGICLNAALHSEQDHPHWDEYHMKLAEWAIAHGKAGTNDE
jgi:hypothetical protein